MMLDVTVPFLVAGGDANWTPRAPEPIQRPVFDRGSGSEPEQFGLRRCAWCAAEFKPREPRIRYCARICALRATHARGERKSTRTA